ncbi:hypothetical protein ACI2KR_07215 [Pseudomonas luteola]
MKVCTFKKTEDLTQFRGLIEKQDQMYFNIMMPGESKGSWKFNRDSNPLAYLSVECNESVVGVIEDGQLSGFAKLKYEINQLSCFEIEMNVDFTYIYVLPLKRGSGVSTKLVQALVDALLAHVEDMSSRFPIERALYTNVYSLPVSPGGLIATMKLKQMMEDVYQKTKLRFLKLSPISFRVDTSMARFKRTHKVYEDKRNAS